MLTRRKPLRRGKPPRRVGARGRAKAAARRECVRRYMQGTLPDKAGNRVLWLLIACAPCQLCGRQMLFRELDYSHKVPAGRGGDGRGLPGMGNGCASCRPCHEFVERDAEARREYIASPANLENGLRVEFTEAVRARHLAWLGRRTSGAPWIS